MASPQKEHGYTPIANELFEAFYCCKLTEYERVCMMHIWRKTYGWSKKEDWIANSQFSEETGIPKPHVARTLKTLKNKNLIVSTARKTKVQKDYSSWKVEWRKLPHQVTGVTSPGNKKLPHQVPTKTIKQLTKTKSETSSLQSNKNDDMWNTKSDDYEEGFVDLDGNGELVEIKKPNTKKYPNAPKVRKIFQEVLGINPAIWKQNKNQLIACENLYTERSLKKVRNALEWYIEHKDEEYCPKINSPWDLDNKWSKLGAYKLSKN